MYTSVQHSTLDYLKINVLSAQHGALDYLALKKIIFKSSVSDPDPVGTVSLGRIRIRFREH